MYDARQIANWFILRAQKDGRKLSIMQLLKLVYIAHGWHLETTGKPLFGNRIEAWQYGPVIPDVYRTFRSKGISVDGEDINFPPNVSGEETKFLEQIWGIYGQLPAFRLSDMTHIDGGPWDIATKSGGYYAIIPDELISQHYSSLRRKAEALAI